MICVCGCTRAVLYVRSSQAVDVGGCVGLGVFVGARVCASVCVRVCASARVPVCARARLRACPSARVPVCACARMCGCAARARACVCVCVCVCHSELLEQACNHLFASYDVHQACLRFDDSLGHSCSIMYLGNNSLIDYRWHMVCRAKQGQADTRVSTNVGDSSTVWWTLCCLLEAAATE